MHQFAPCYLLTSQICQVADTTTSEGSFNNYVDMILSFFDHLPKYLSWTFYQLNLEFFDHIQVNLCQKHSFLNQLTHNMTTDCSLNPEFSTRKFQAQNMLCTNIVFCFCFDIQNNLCTQHVLSLEFSCTELGIQ